jgi:ABC-type uncharacterized transport system substrate-binding protein
MSNVGFLLATSPNDWSSYVARFKTKLKALNPNASVNVYPTNGAGGDADAVLQAATYLANNCNVIVTAGTMGALACQKATQANQKPFVFASVGDARISGLTPQPGGNFTGGSNGQVTFVPERVAYMLNNKKPVFIEPFAVVGNYNNQPAKSAMDAAFSELTNNHGKQARLASLDPQTDISEFINDLQGKGIKSLYVCSDLWITVHSTALNIEARDAGMNTMWEIEEQKLIHLADAAYGVGFRAMFEMAAEYVDDILGGTKPGTLPLYEPPLPPPTSRTKRKKKSQASRTKTRPASVTKKKSRRGR